MIIFSGSKSILLTKKVVRETNIDIGEREIREFPDSEIYVRILSDVHNETCILIQSITDNSAMIETFLFLDALRDLGAERIHAILPYLAYSRQDKRFERGEALSAKTVLNIIDDLSDSITVINSHFLNNEGVYNFHGVEINNLDAFPLLVEYFKNRFNNAIIIAPDEGVKEYVSNAAKLFGCEFDYLEKKRIDSNNVEIKPKNVDVNGKDVVILDDMISTGGTMIEASKSLKSMGARTINIGCVHGVFSKGTEIFDSICNTLVCTDTIERKESDISVARLIGEWILKNLP